MNHYTATVVPNFLTSAVLRRTYIRLRDCDSLVGMWKQQKNGKKCCSCGAMEVNFKNTVMIFEKLERLKKLVKQS